jgi:hypothetical protein
VIAPLAVVVVVIVSAYARVNAVLLGQHFSVPVIGIVALAVVLVLVLMVLWLIRSIVQDGGFLFLRPTVVKL